MTGIIPESLPAMTVPSEQSRIQYTTDGTSGSFPVPFRFLNAAHLQVARQHKDESSILELGVDYSVSGVGNQAGGTITTTATLPAGDSISIERVVPITQETAYQRNDPFPERAHEQALDKLTMICQMLGGVLGLTPGSSNRALLLGAGDLDGSGAYRANGNRIQEVGDAKGMLDAVNKKIMLDHLSGLSTDGSGQFVVERLKDPSPGNGADMVAMGGGKTLSDLQGADGGVLVGFIQAGDEATHRTQLSKSRDAININDFDGNLLAVDKNSRSQTYTLPAGEYMFNGENLPNISRLVADGDVVIKNDIYSGIVQRDSGTGIHFLHHNHLEQSFKTTTHAPITSGNIPPPPLFTGPKQSDVNVLAYWYNDFGKESTRAAGGAKGGLTWYYWDWLFHGSAGDYDASRQPTLGYYRGDDVNVLDWQCYWLSKAGVTGVIPQTIGAGDVFGRLRQVWIDPTDENYWMYQLFENAKNFKTLTYALWPWSRSNEYSEANRKNVIDSFTEIAAIYNQYKNVSVIEKNGRVYPIVFVFETQFWRGAFDNYIGSEKTIEMLKDQAAKFKAIGYDGLAVLGRNNSSELVGNQELENAGVLVYSAGYTDTYNGFLNGGKSATTYEDLAIGADTRQSNTYSHAYCVPCLRTAAKSHVPHPSNWDWPGSTPKLFELMCSNVLRRMSRNGSPKILTIYNVSEWAEGGPSLQPNMRDGDGYLNALSSALANAPKLTSRSRTQPIFNKAGPTIPIVVTGDVDVVQVDVTYAFTSTSTPEINDQSVYHGKKIKLHIPLSSRHQGPLTLQDKSIFAGSGLRLMNDTIAIKRGGSVDFMYDHSTREWIQTSQVIAIK